MIEQVLGALALAGVNARPFFWRTHGGAEVDLLLDTGTAIVPVEVKLSGSPAVPRGLLECMKDLSCPAWLRPSWRSRGVLDGPGRARPAGPSRGAARSPVRSAATAAEAFSAGLIGPSAARPGCRRSRSPPETPSG